MNDEYDEKIDEWLATRGDKLLSSCGIPVNKTRTPDEIIADAVEDIPPALYETILKQYIMRDATWIRIGTVTKTLLDGYKRALLAMSVSGALDALTANSLIDSCDKVVGGIKTMETVPEEEEG